MLYIVQDLKNLLPIMNTNQESINFGEGIYSARDMSSILGIPLNRCNYWFKAYLRNKLSEITNYKYHFDIDFGTYVNFKTLLQFYVFEKLRRAGHKPNKILKSYSVLSKLFDTPYPFILPQVLKLGGDIIYLDNGKYVSTDGKFQLHLKEIITPFLEKIAFDENGVPQAFYPYGKDVNIIVDPRIQFGAPTIKGTRIEVDSIRNLLESGEPIKQISKTYDLPPNLIEEVIQFNLAV